MTLASFSSNGSSNSSKSNARNGAISFAAVAAAAFVLSAFLRPALADVVMPDIPKAKGDKCVEETSFMRRNHMDLLKHQRDDTLRKGIRTKKHSLQGCLDCHAVYEDDAKTIAVTIKSEKHFCNSCHNYAAVKIDCFGCHNSKPFVKKAPRKTASLLDPSKSESDIQL